MKNDKIFIYLFVFLIFLSILGIVLSYINQSILILLISIFLLVVSIISIITQQSMMLFIRDKELDIEKLEKSGLTIIKCKICKKVNVLEDQYCIYCGEQLGE